MRWPESSFSLEECVFPGIYELRNSGNHDSHVRNGPAHDPSGTGETDSWSGGLSYETRARFRARLGCDPADWDRRGGSLSVFSDQRWFAGCKGCVKGWREG